MNFVTLSPESFKVFMWHVNDAGNWSGHPMVIISAAQRGNLTDLKRKGLLVTDTDEGVEFIYFQFDEVVVICGDQFHYITKVEERYYASINVVL